MLNGWHTVLRDLAFGRARVGALVIGAIAALAMGIVGCTSIIGGTAAVDTSDAAVYRSSVAASVETSSSRESQRQVRGACEKFARASVDAVETVNKYVEAFNNGGDISGTSGPAVDALNQSADDVAAARSDALSTELRDAFDSYVEAARGVATAISNRAPVPVYNTRKDELNNVREKGLKLCKTY